mgnify:CR=1 FL=1
MAVRPIDAVQVLKDINLHHKPTPVSEFESGFNNGLNQAMWEITHAPTLTQPNEWVSVYDRLPEPGERVLATEQIALSALRGPTREQVENVWRGEWKAAVDMGIAKIYECSVCHTRKADYSSFCPNCGAPMTDEAVDMVMERLEEICK